MKKFIALIAMTTMACTSTQPVLANDFGGVYIQGTAGFEDVTARPSTNDVVYGVSGGVNIPVGDTIVGVEGTVENVFENARELGASARLGYTFDNVLLYGEAGYTNYRDAFSQKLDGLRVGGGAEVNLSDHTFVSVEYRYTDFEDNAGKHAGLVGLGLRF